MLIHELLIFPGVFVTFMCKKVVLKPRSGLCSNESIQIENKSVKIEQLLCLIHNFTYVVSVKWSTSQMHIFEKN